MRCNFENGKCKCGRKAPAGSEGRVIAAECRLGFPAKGSGDRLASFINRWLKLKACGRCKRLILLMNSQGSDWCKANRRRLSEMMVKRAVRPRTLLAKAFFRLPVTIQRAIIELAILRVA